jgi:hypothetical protein
MAAPEATNETGRVGESAPNASDRARENTQKLCYISVNSLLPVRLLIKSPRVLHVEPALPASVIARAASHETCENQADGEHRITISYRRDDSLDITAGSPTGWPGISATRRAGHEI